MLFVLIPTAWLAVLLFALNMCRLAARSDDSHEATLTRQLIASQFVDHGAAAAETAVEQPPSDAERGTHRAAG